MGKHYTLVYAAYFFCAALACAALAYVFWSYAFVDFRLSTEELLFGQRSAQNGEAESMQKIFVNDDQARSSRARSSNKVKGAFVYLAKDTNRFNLLRSSLESLGQHFNYEHQYSIFVFVGDANAVKPYIAGINMSINIVEIDEEDWKVNQPNGSYPLVFNFRGTLHFSLSYRQMSRYSAGFLLTNPALNSFDYALKLDTDTFLTRQWTKDPFVEMHKKNKKFAYWKAYVDIPEICRNLGEWFKAYAEEKKLPLSRHLFKDGTFLRTNFYGCFLGAKLDFLRAPEYKELFRRFDETGGWFKYRWDEQKLYAFYATGYASDEELECLTYTPVSHQEANAPRCLKPNTTTLG